ncbi:hypothetical protein [Chitinimonas naiadis]
MSTHATTCKTLDAPTPKHRQSAGRAPITRYIYQAARRAPDAEELPEVGVLDGYQGYIADAACFTH